MKRRVFTVCAVFAFGALHAQPTTWQASPGHTQVPIWPGTPPDARLLGGVDHSLIVAERVRACRVRIGANEGDRNGPLDWCSGLVDRGLYDRFRRKCSGTGLSMNVVRTMPPCPAASSERSCRDLRSPELTVKRDASNEHCGSYPNACLGLALTGWNGASEYS
jgi:hypothetical protein